MTYFLVRSWNSYNDIRWPDAETNGTNITNVLKKIIQSVGDRYVSFGSIITSKILILMTFLLENYNIEIVITIWITLKLYLLKIIYDVSILVLERAFTKKPLKLHKVIYWAKDVARSGNTFFEIIVGHCLLHERRSSLPSSEKFCK